MNDVITQTYMCPICEDGVARKLYNFTYHLMDEHGCWKPYGGTGMMVMSGRTFQCFCGESWEHMNVLSEWDGILEHIKKNDLKVCATIGALR